MADVNSGIDTRQKVKQRDGQMAALLHQVYGDMPWRYWHDCPAAFPCPGRHERAGCHPLAGSLHLSELLTTPHQPLCIGVYYCAVGFDQSLHYRFLPDVMGRPVQHAGGCLVSFSRVEYVLCRRARALLWELQ